MKKLTAIFFLLLFAFNWFGYRMLYDYMQHSSNQNLEFLFDNNNYDESQLVEIKIAVHMPYQSNWSAFERYNGEVELNGTLYKYVKRKLLNDTLYLMCLPNTQKMDLETAKNDFFKISNDLSDQNNSKTTDNSLSVFKNLQPVFNNSLFDLSINSLIIDESYAWLPLKNGTLLYSAHISPEQPPDVLI